MKIVTLGQFKNTQKNLRCSLASQYEFSLGVARYEADC